MPKSTRVFLSLILLLSSFACKQKKENKVPLIMTYTWLIGTWNSTENPSVYELWTFQDSVYMGEAIRIISGDTMLLEKMFITKDSNGLDFTAVLSDTIEAVVFASFNLTENVLNFSNKNHDYPTNISYSKIGNNSLRAEVSGKGRKERFLFVRR
ncbi:MAG: DUF6265 family protein [Vicingaceae bacterium]